MPDVADLKRRARAAAHALKTAPQAGGLVDAVVDWTGWLEATAGEVLDELDTRADAGALTYPDLRLLDDDVWAMLLSRSFTGWPALQRFLPDVPEPELQQLWNGASGARLAAQTTAFVQKLRARFAAHGDVALHAARVLDHGIGWGRIARNLARDAGELHGTDPSQMILDVCSRDGVPATLHKTDFLPASLPVGDVDLAYAFSVFTHTSERATDVNLTALHDALKPGGILVATVRPPGYAELVPGLRAPEGAEHVFLPHPADPSHFQYDGGEMTYGEAIVSLAHVRERWAPRFELLDAAPLVVDPHQVVLVLRRR